LPLESKGVREHAVEEHESERGKDKKVELLPQGPSHLQAKVGRT